MNRYLFFADGTIKASIMTARRGFLHGEELGCLRNLSGAIIIGVELALVELLAFKAVDHVKNVEHVVVSKFIQQYVKPKPPPSMIDVRLDVPPSELPEPTFEGNCIKRGYLLKATVKLEKPVLVKLFERELVLQLTLIRTIYSRVLSSIRRATSVQ